MRKTITGTGGMLLIQTLKDAGVDYLFTNPGSAETGIFAALAEDQDQRLVIGNLIVRREDNCRASLAIAVMIAHHCPDDAALAKSGRLDTHFRLEDAGLVGSTCSSYQL